MKRVLVLGQQRPEFAAAAVNFLLDCMVQDNNTVFYPATAKLASQVREKRASNKIDW